MEYIKGLIHSEASIHPIKLGHKRTNEDKLEIASANTQAQPVIVTINKMGENK